MIASALIAPTLSGVGAQASTLTRSEQPLVIPGAQAGTMLGAAPGDVVAFRHSGTAWEQIPVQVDERKMMNIRQAYPASVGPCSDPCYNPGSRQWWELVYADPNTLTGIETTQTVTVTSGPVCSGLGLAAGQVPMTCTYQNSSALDADDEIALMVKDAGPKAPAGAGSPFGVLGNGVEIAATDTLDNGAGYVYLFRRDAGAASPLDPSAGTSYVTYKWVVNHIAAAHPSDPNATENFYKSEYRFNGRAGNAAVGNPESSWVDTAHYRREMTGRWTDNGLIHKRGAAPVSLLGRHDASITFDNVSACTRWQGTFDIGEMAYLTSKGGPIRAIRSYLGTNSGPFVERTQIFYESSEVENINLRVHPIPGASEIWNWNANAVGMRYSTQFGSDRIDGAGSTYPGFPAIAPGSWLWETVDRDTPADPSNGGLTFTVRYDSNNPDPLAHSLYRDSGNGGCGNQKYYGASIAQGPLVLNSTDTDALGAGSGTQSTYLTIDRTLHYEETGAADGAARLAQDSTPLKLTVTDR